MTRIMKSATVLASLFSFSFVLNFVWESFHAVYLYQEHDIHSSTYIPMMLYVSRVDGLLIAGMYLTVAALWRDFLWIKEFSRGSLLAFVLAGLVLAAVIEYRALFVLERWSYQAHMPTIFGLGLSPLAQLSTTGLLALWLTRQLLYGQGLFRNR